MDLLAIVRGVIGAILLFVPIIFVLLLTHEFGHFLTARLFKMSVAEFGIGYPPRIRTLFWRGGVEYTLNWLPLGGFVGFEDNPADPNSFGHKPAWQRLCVLASGALVNLFSAVLIFAALALFVGSDVPQFRVGVARVEPGSPAALSGIQVGDMIVSINNRTASSSDVVAEEALLNAGSKVNMVIQRGTTTQVLTLALRKPEAGKGAIGVNLLAVYNGLAVENLSSDSLSYTAGLRNGDHIIAVGSTSVIGQPVSDSMALANAIAGRPMVNLTVERGSRVIKVDGVKLTDNEGSRQFADFGIAVPYQHISYNLLDALGQGFACTGSAVGEMLVTFKALFQGSIAVTSLSGPVGIGALTNQVAAQAGFVGLLGLAAFLAVNLFFVNLLPIPSLDGGRLLFVIIEMLLRPWGQRRVPAQIESKIHFAGYMLLLLFVLIITISDIGHLVTT